MIFEALGEVIGRAIGSLIRSIQGLISFKPEQLKAMDREIAGGTLDEKIFRTPEARKFVKEMKEELKGSPEGLLDWFMTAYFSFCQCVYDAMMTVLIPKKAASFEDAKAEGGHLTMLMVDFVALSAVIDIVATAASATLVRNITRIAQLYASTFGLNRYVNTVIEPAMGPMFLNVLRQGWNETSPTLIPGSTDLVRMETREVWREEFREELLTPEPTEDFYKYMAKQGFSKFHADSYWAAHWGLPSVGQGYDAYHRLPGFDLEALKKLMVRLDILPFYQDMLIKLAWRLPGAIETRWMYRYGEVPVEALEDLLVKDGLDPEWAPRVARAIAKNQFTGEIGKLRDNAKADYVKGYRTEPELRAELGTLEIPPSWIEYHVADAVSDAERAHRDAKVTIYVDAWQKDLIPNEETFRRDLETVIVRPEVIDRIIEREYIRKYKKPAVVRDVEAEKVLERIKTYRISLAVEEYRKCVTEKPELVIDLIEAGLDPAEAGARADYEEARRPIKKPTEAEIVRLKEVRDLRKVEEKAAVEAFRKDVTTAEQLIARIIELGESEAMATAIAQLEILKKLPKPKA